MKRIKQATPAQCKIAGLRNILENSAGSEHRMDCDMSTNQYAREWLRCRESLKRHVKDVLHDLELTNDDDYMKAHRVGEIRAVTYFVGLLLDGYGGL